MNLRNLLYCEDCFCAGNLGPDTVYRQVSTRENLYYQLAQKHDVRVLFGKGILENGKHQHGASRVTVPSWFVHEAINTVMDEMKNTAKGSPQAPDYPSQNRLKQLQASRQVNIDLLNGHHPQSDPKSHLRNIHTWESEMTEEMARHQRLYEMKLKVARVEDWYLVKDGEWTQEQIEASIRLITVGSDQLTIYTAIGTEVIVNIPRKPDRHKDIEV